MDRQVQRKPKEKREERSEDGVQFKKNQGGVGQKILVMSAMKKQIGLE
jgi:hypothetical protein